MADQGSTDDVWARPDQLLRSRGWSCYHLSMAGVPRSEQKTISLSHLDLVQVRLRPPEPLGLLSPALLQCRGHLCIPDIQVVHPSRHSPLTHLRPFGTYDREIRLYRYAKPRPARQPGGSVHTGDAVCPHLQ